MRETAKQRFFEKVDKNAPNGCWEWTAGKDGDGYGQFCYNGNTTRAHRFSYELFKGPIPEGKCVCHTCDNKRCVNPNHLWLGTHMDNVRDAIEKGRLDHHALNQIKGSKHCCAKLTEDIVSIARKEYADGASIRYLANKYGITEMPMSYALKRKTWKHVS